MSDLIEQLRKDLEPYRGKTVGSLRIDMGEVQKILATADQLEAQQAEIAQLKSRYSNVNEQLFSASLAYENEHIEKYGLETEIARLRELVKGSYQEGFEDAQHQASSWEIGGHEETWELSLTRKALEQKP